MASGSGVELPLSDDRSPWHAPIPLGVAHSLVPHAISLIRLLFISSPIRCSSFVVKFCISPMPTTYKYLFPKIHDSENLYLAHIEARRAATLHRISRGSSSMMAQKRKGITWLVSDNFSRSAVSEDWTKVPSLPTVLRRSTRDRRLSQLAPNVCIGYHHDKRSAYLHPHPRHAGLPHRPPGGQQGFFRCASTFLRSSQDASGSRPGRTAPKERGSGPVAPVEPSSMARPQPWIPRPTQ